MKAKQDRWYETSREVRREYNASKKYGLTLAEYDEMVRQPCRLCGSTTKVVVDHDHETGKVRGPLCSHCNTGIGLLQDNPALMRKAAEYVERHGDIRDDAVVTKYTARLPAGFGGVE